MDLKLVLAASGTAVAACVGFRWTLHRLTRTPPPKQLSVQITGLPPKKGTPVLALMAGFPDDHGTWDEIAPRFASTCTVVSMVMPDYDTGSLARYWGHSLPQIADMLEATLSDVVPDGDKATLVAHDWGAAVAMMYLKRPQALGKVDRLVLMDVGPSPDRSFRNAVAILTYQTYLSLAFLVGRCTLDIFGDIMLALFPWKAIGPCPHETRVPKRTSGYRVACRMAYPYFWIQSALLFRPSSLDLPWGSAYPAKPLVVPTTFVFGKNKRAQFHTKGFLERMEKADGYSVVELDCGHFIQVQKPDEVEAAIRQRMAG